jgi:hypothetical protein
MKPTVFVLLPLAVLLMAGKKAEPFFLDPTVQHKDYPAKDFICGIGSSTDSPGAAMQNARGDVSRQIRSKLQGAAVQVQEFAIEGKKTKQASQRFTDTIIERYSFSRPALIKSVAVHPPWRKDNAHRAYACLERDKAADAILVGLKGVRQQLKNSLKLAEDANNARSVSALAVQCAAAQQAANKILDALVELRVIAGPRSIERELELDLQPLVGLSEMASEWRKLQQVAVVVEDSAGAHADAVRGKIQSALHQLGVAATGRAKRCSAPQGSTHVLMVSPNIRCSDGDVSRMCKIGFRVKIEECESGTSATGRLDNKAFRGTDDQWDEAQARTRAWRNVTSQGLQPGLIEVLQTMVPLD